MRVRYTGWVFCAVALLGSCSAPRSADAKLTVAAAANLIDVFSGVGRAFQAKTGVDVIFSYGSTAQLATQIENGAPFDVFAAADTEHVDSLVARKKLTADSRAVYALGQLALWMPDGEQSGVHELRDLAGPQIRFVAIAQPDLAPYGAATVEVLKGAGLWDRVQPKLVYGTSISMAKQFAASGSANAAFTAYSLVLHEKGTVLKLDPHLYKPIEQAMGIVAASEHQGAAKQFRQFLLGAEGRTILANSGYLLP
ncbi:MAG: molybdate ABC transporter substrate-binding protein [Acidobacteriia bacterium]|nr:molybdate ABC transporter substrate-binding protein [Terriglobia bacterium]